MPIGKCILGAGVVFALAVCALAQQPAGATAKNGGEDEEKILQAAKLATDNSALLAYLQARTLKEEDRVRIERLVQDLDSSKYTVRENATKALKQLARPALPFLKKALKNSPLEVAQRAEKCIKEISARAAVEPIADVARLLALREVPGASDVLLNYLPFADDPYLEEEVLTNLGKLTVRDGKIDPLLMGALKDGLPEKRAAAVYVIAQRADMSQRELVRQMLGDADPQTHNYAASGLIGKQVLQQLEDNLQSDLDLLHQAKVDIEDIALGQFLAKRSLRDEDRWRLQNLIAELADKSYAKREKATRQLIAEGTRALPFLKTATSDADSERTTRAGNCIKAINARNPPDPAPAAVIRVLAQAGKRGDRPPAMGDPRTLQPAEAIAALLDYVPFVEDESLEDEIISTLNILSVRDVKLPTLLTAALDDAQPARRGAAAVVLGKVGTRDHVEAVRKLLHDPVARVQFRAAQGLLAAQDKAAIPALIELLGTAPPAWLWQVDEQLARVAGGCPPVVPAANASAELRKKSMTAWTSWWLLNENKIDLAGAQRNQGFVGAYTIVEFDTQQGNRQGRIWECGRDGRQRWEVTNLGGAMDGQVLPNGRLLISESSFSRVSERDLKGNIVWTVPTPSPPVAVLRLPNGNTFIAMYNHVMEVKDAKPVYTLSKSPQMFIYGASRMRNGHIALMTAQSLVIFDPVSGQDVKNINLGPINGWAGVDALPNGRFLVALMNMNQIREVDEAGKVHWQTNYQGVFRALKLPNGNVLACSMTTRRVAELDRNGNEIWGVTCQGRPWNMRFR
jgi:HEAT repeat protein